MIWKMNKIRNAIQILNRKRQLIDLTTIDECEKMLATEQHFEKTERSIMIFLSFCFEE